MTVIHIPDKPRNDGVMWLTNATVTMSQRGESDIIGIVSERGADCMPIKNRENAIESMTSRNRTAIQND